MKRWLKKFTVILLTAGLMIGIVADGGMMGYAAGSEDDSIVVANGLIGYWTFDGDSDTDRLASKASAAGVMAAVTGSGVTVQSGNGIEGGSVSFSSSSDSYLTLDLTDAHKLLPSQNAFTVGAWVKYDETFNPSRTSVFHQDGTNTGRAILMIDGSGSNMRYGTYLANSNQFGTAKVEAGKWHHVMLSVGASGSDRKANFYINGELANDAAGVAFAQALVDGSGNIRVGAHRQNANNAAIKGVMDEIRYYDRTLSAEEVQTIYNVHGERIAIENAKKELQEMIATAQGLTGGSQGAKEVLDGVIAEINGLLDDDSVTLSTLETKKTALEEAIADYHASAPVSIAVDTSDELRSIPSVMFGINHRYHNYGYGSWDAENDKVFDAFNALAKDAGFGSVRYPGGTVSNLFTWKDSIGPKDQRTTTIAGNNFYSNAGETPVDPAFGVDEAMTWIYDDLGSEAIFVYGLGRGNPSDAADLVEYLNAENDGSNPNGGIDWAAVRAENGHEEPYGVKRFEIGNEYSDAGQNYWMSGSSENNKGVVDLYIEGDRMTISGQENNYYQTNNKVAKKGDWRAAASRSDGAPNEERYVYYLPVVEDSAEVLVSGEKWEIVDSLDGQGAANVCTFDYETGKITFGDGTNGNIPTSGAEIRCNYKTDQSGFVDYYDAMQAVAAQTKTEIEIYSGIVDRHQNSFIDKMHEKGYDDKYDGVIIHKYSRNVSSYEDSLVKAKNFANDIASYKTRMDGKAGTEMDKKVAVSEFGIYNVSPASNYQTSLGHAIYIANQMIDYINSGAAYLNKHCLVDTTSASDNLGAWQQCVIQSHQTATGYEYVSTPSARLFSLFHNMTGSVEINQTITGNTVFSGSGTGAVMDLNVYSTKDEYGNVYVMAVNNKENNETAVNISVDDLDLTGKEIDVWYLTSENVEDMNTLQEPDKIFVQKAKVTGSGTALSYTLQPHSVYAFQIPTRKVNVTVKAEEGGTVSGGSDAAVVGEEITVTAVPEEGYEFVGWYDGEEKVSENASYTFTVSEAVTLTAKFFKIITLVYPPEKVNEEADQTFAEGKFNYQILDESAKTVVLKSIIEEKTKNAKTITIPATVERNEAQYKVTQIGENAFANCKKLTKVTIGKNVVKIEKNAFLGCKKLSKIVLKGKALKTVESGAFQNTSKKLTVTASKVKKAKKKKLQAVMRKGGNKKLKVK